MSLKIIIKNIIFVPFNKQIKLYIVAMKV